MACVGGLVQLVFEQCHGVRVALGAALGLERLHGSHHGIHRPLAHHAEEAGERGHGRDERAEEVCQNGNEDGESDAERDDAAKAERGVEAVPPRLAPLGLVAFAEIHQPTFGFVQPAEGGGVVGLEIGDGSVFRGQLTLGFHALGGFFAEEAVHDAAVFEQIGEGRLGQEHGGAVVEFFGDLHGAVGGRRFVESVSHGGDVHGRGLCHLLAGRRHAHARGLAGVGGAARAEDHQSEGGQKGDEVRGHFLLINKAVVYSAGATFSVNVCTSDDPLELVATTE